MRAVPEIVSAVLAHAAQCLPRECCGLVVRDAAGERYIPCRNIAMRSDDFEIDPDDFMHAEDAGEIVMVAHSHVFEPARPSLADLVGCESSGLPWLIVQAQSGVHVVIEPNGFEAPLIGRPYRYGVLDCWTLVRDWFHQVRGIALDPISAEEGWDKKGLDLFRLHMGAQGFIEIGADEAAPGDVPLMQFGTTVPNHIGVLLEDGRLLHHCKDRDSSVDVFGRHWRQYTVGAARYIGNS
ncbi:MAG: C40 family peptidase [Rhodocyclaceae bacterium]